MTWRDGRGVQSYVGLQIDSKEYWVGTMVGMDDLIAGMEEGRRMGDKFDIA